MGHGNSDLRDANEIVDLQKTKINHHTDMFDETFMILRRGFWVDFLIDLNQVDLVKTINAKAATERERNGNKALTEVHLRKDDTEESHTGFKLEADKKRVLISPNCIIGEWTLSINGGAKTEIVILFNPWCENDSVYLENQNWIKKYLLDTTGKIYTSRNNYTHWTFGQFEKGVLDAVIDVLNRSTGLTPVAKASPIEVSRALSATINANDEDNGLIVGKWTGEYEGGTPPQDWTSSVDIYRQFIQNGAMVKYGQCWVFSGCMTTALRCLGIASRSVTCIGSLHDKNTNVVEDNFYEMSGNTRKKLTDMSDSLWNFHVWNEGWFKRPDLGENYSGWQVVDATPQEDSNNIKQLGPASVTAVKEGNCHLQYDAGFVFAETNGDSAIWYRPSPDAKFKLEKIYNDSERIGIAVMTDSVGGGDKDNITADYKPAEGSPEEREQVKRAISHGSRPDIYKEVSVREDSIKIESDLPESFVMNKNLPFKLTFKTSANLKTNLKVVCNIVAYHGKLLKEIFHDEKVIELPKDSNYAGEVTQKHVEGFTKENTFLVFSVFCRIESANDVVAEKFQVELDSNKPKLEFITPEPYKSGRTIELKNQYRNLQDFELTKPVFKVDAPYMRSQKIFNLGAPVKGKDTAYIKFKYTPRVTGEIEIVGSFMCEEFPASNTSLKVDIGNSEAEAHADHPVPEEHAGAS